MDLSRDSFTNKGSSSLLYYTPKSQMDYGTVLCVASNVVGRQVVPCIYHVIPAGNIQFILWKEILFYRFFRPLKYFSNSSLSSTYEKPQNANLLVERHRFWLNCSFVASHEQQLWNSGIRQNPRFAAAIARNWIVVVGKCTIFNFLIARSN